MDLDIIRERLAAERDRLLELRRLDLATGLDGAGGADWVPDEPHDPGDAASEVFEQERDQSVAESVDSELTLVADARARVEDGTYGRCVVCGRDIGQERLEARPMTPYCIEHQRVAESQARAGGYEGADPTT